LVVWFFKKIALFLAEKEKEHIQHLITVKMKISRGGNSQLVVSCQVVTTPCCGLAGIFCGFISHLTGRETINIPEIYSGVHSFTGKTVKTEVMVRCALLLHCILARIL